MPVGDGDIVLGINIRTGLTQNVEIPPTDRNVRPIVLHPEYGLMTLTNIQEVFGGTLYNDNTELYEIGSPIGLFDWLIVNAPYIEMYGEEDNLNYTDTDTFNYQLNYQVISSAGSAQVDITPEEDLQRGGGAGGRGGGGGGDGSGSQDGDGTGGPDEDIKPFPAPPENPDGLEHTCSDEEPPEPPPGPPGPPGPPPEPGPPEEPCAACAAGIPKGGQGPTETESGTLSGSGQNQMDSGESGDSQGEGQGEGSGESQGESQGQGQGEGSGEGQGSGSGEGQGEGSGEGSGEPSGSGQGQGEGPSSGGGEGEGEGQGEGSGEPSGEASGSGQGEPSDSGEGQPTPDNQSGEASGGSESAPPQDSLLQQLMDEQEARSQDGGGEGPPSESGDSPDAGPPSDSGQPTTPSDFMDDSTPSEEPSDNYDDIFDDSSPFGPPDDSPAMNPDDFMDMPPQDPSPADEELPLTNDNMDDGNSYPLDIQPFADRPFENLSDDELQQLIDELRETPDPTNPDDFMDEDTIDDVTPQQPQPDDEPGPNQGDGEPSDRAGQGDNTTDEMPDLSNDSNSTSESGQSWLWINVGTAELYSGVSAPSTGIWVHALYAEGMEQSDPMQFPSIPPVIMTFDEMRRLLGSQEVTYYQPLPTMITIDFDNLNLYADVQNQMQYAMQGQYWDFEYNEIGQSISITFNYLPQSDDTRPRWVPMSSDDVDLSSSTYDESQAAAQEMIEQINQENQMANDADIPTGYGEGSTSPFVPDNESNAALQEAAAKAGAAAAKGDGQMAQEGASNETDNARKSAQQNARDTAQSNDLDSAIESTSEAIANAMRANAAADPNNTEDVINRNDALTAANESLDSLSELLDADVPAQMDGVENLDADVQSMIDTTREQLNNLDIGEGESIAQALRDEAKNARDTAMESDSPEVKADNAMKATEAAVQARQEANTGDDKDREAVQEAINMAQQAIDAANEWDSSTEATQELLDSIPPFNELPELAIDAEARMRDTMPGEFADINNPDVAEDMMVVAEQAVSNLEQAVAESNPANEQDKAATEYIAQKTQATIDNVEGSWGGDPEEIQELRERVNDALAEFSRDVQNICALWNPNTMSWYRGTTGDILIFDNMESALIYGVQRYMIPNTVPSLPEDWETREVTPIGVGGVI